MFRLCMSFYIILAAVSGKTIKNKPGLDVKRTIGLLPPDNFFQPVLKTELCGRPNTYNCSSGDCIPADQRCNGIRFQCLNNADEENCDSCTNGAFYCTADRECIPQDYRCDNVPDCTNDEVDCPCLEFRCDNNVCVNIGFKCDGLNNCGDRSDEMDCDKCVESDDSYQAFYCATDRTCIPDGWLCDGEADCSLGHEDEENCP